MWGGGRQGAKVMDRPGSRTPGPDLVQKLKGPVLLVAQEDRCWQDPCVTCKGETYKGKLRISRWLFKQSIKPSIRPLIALVGHPGRGRGGKKRQEDLGSGP